MTPEEVLELTLRQAKRETVAELSETDAREMARRAIAAAQIKKKPRAYGWIAVAAAALLCVLAGFAAATLNQDEAASFVQKRELEPGLVPAGLETTGLETTGLEPAELAAVPDGQFTPEASADVHLPTGDRLLSVNGSHYDVVSTDADRVVALAEGDVLFDIESIAGGSFVVDAGDTQVRVIGTVFSVRRTELGVAVLVYEGRVSVTDAGGERVLGAGEFWASDRTLADDAWRRTSEARWTALLRESATGLAEPEPRAAGVSQAADSPQQSQGGDSSESSGASPVEPEAARALLLRREYRDVLAVATAEMNENGRTVEWTVVAADAYRGLRDWDAAAAMYRAAAALARDSRRAQLGYAAAQIYADRLRRPRLALEALQEARSVSTESIIEERARSLQIRLLRDTHQDGALQQAVDAYLERFPDTYTARRLRSEH